MIYVSQYYSTTKTYCKINLEDFLELYLFLGKVIDFSRVYLVLYKSPEKKKNYQNLVKTTSFERYFSKKGAFFSRGRGHKILNLQGQNLFGGGNKQVQGAPPCPPVEESQS